MLVPLDTALSAPSAEQDGHVFAHVEQYALKQEAEAFLRQTEQPRRFEDEAGRHPELPAEVQARLTTAGQTAQAHVAAFNERFTKRFARISAVFHELQRRRHKKLDALKKLRAAGEEFSAGALPHSACRAKCQHCCHIPVAISVSEARLMGKALGLVPHEVARSDWLSRKPYGYEHPCPFLTPQGCGIYEERPLACRVHLNMDKDDLLCRLLPGRTVPVPLANATSFYMLYAKVTEGDTLADIREYFPTGLNK